MKFYQDEAYAVMKDPNHALGTAPPFAKQPIYSLAFLKSWSMQFQLISVIMLAVLFYVVPRTH
jgi:hypothetical protein